MKPLLLIAVIVILASIEFLNPVTARSTQTEGPQNQARHTPADSKGAGTAQTGRVRSSRQKGTRDIAPSGDPRPGRELDSKSNAPSTKSFALIIGISRYKNLPAKNQLLFADEDARSLRDFLVGPKGGFNPENVTLLVNEEATRELILRSLERLPARAGTGDLALIFFAGHGLVNRSQQGFLLAYDSQPADLLVTSVRMDEFNSTLRNLRTRSTVIFSDACHSGTIGDLLSQQDPLGPVTNVSAKTFAVPTGRVDQSSFILSAASPTQASLEIDKLKHGLFTYHLLEGLAGKADNNADELVNTKELYDYVSIHVRQDAEQLGLTQVPEFNPLYDPSIPAAHLSEAGASLRQQWFDSDPFVSRYAALFDDALSAERLTRPEQQSAWDYLNLLIPYMRTPPELVMQKREELLAKLRTKAQAVIDQSPSDPKLWNEASDWFDRAHQISPGDKGLRANQYYCAAMAWHHSSEGTRAERECDTALNTIEENHLKEPLLCLRIAQFYKRISNWVKARRGYRLAVEADAKVDWLGEYAEVLIQTNDFVEAEAQLRRALLQDANYPNGLKLLAEVILRSDQKEKFGEAVNLAKHAQQLRPGEIEIEEVYGWALLRSGNPLQAIEPLRKVARHWLSNERYRDTALVRLSQAFAQSGDLARSISALREAEEKRSQSAEVYEYLGQRLQEDGDIEGAIDAAETAVRLSQDDEHQKARRLRIVAELMERVGKLDEAALRYRSAALVTRDARVNASLENHSKVLLQRAGRQQDLGPQSKRPSLRKQLSNPASLIIVEGGREALEYLTGVSTSIANEINALAQVFDACLRDSTMRSRLIDFYENYPRLARKVESSGAKLGVRLDLSPVNQPASEAARDALNFFGIKDKNGRREINEKEFESKRRILEALDGDAGQLRRGERTTLRFKNDEFPVIFGMTEWVRKIRDINKRKDNEYLLAFLKDEHAMRLYVALSMLPEEAAKRFFERVNNPDDDIKKELGAGLYFAAPYLRFGQNGDLYLPGQRPGAENWQRVLEVTSPRVAGEVIFKRENSEVLYLFAALSAAGEVGDFIARSELFDKFYHLLKNSERPLTREPFDLIDLLLHLRVDEEKLRLPKSVELWFSAGKKDEDTVLAVVSKITTSPPGRQIDIVRQIAALDQIEHERPEWLSDMKAIERIMNQLSSRREAQIELALDLDLSLEQLENYLALVDRIEAKSTPAFKTVAILATQSAFELLRLGARNGILDPAKVNEVASRFIELDPGDERFAYGLMNVIKKDLLGIRSPLSGKEAQEKLVTLLAGRGSLVLKSDQRVHQRANGPDSDTEFFEFASSKFEQDRIARAMSGQKHTSFQAVVDAAAELDALENNPADDAVLQRLRDALQTFVEPDPPPPPKKAKKPVVNQPTLKQIAAQLTTPVAFSAIADLRNRVAPFLGEALLGAVYAAILNPMPEGAGYEEIVHNHDLGPDPWGSAEFDSSRRSVRGNVARLSYALAQIGSLSWQSGRSSAAAPGSLASPYHVAILNSYQLVNQRWVTNRALEYVARSIDLGEDVLGLFLLRDANAQAIAARLEEFISPRRAQVVRAWLAQEELNEAIGALTLSELYYIGQRYFSLMSANLPLSSLASEPGALGALARLVTANNSPEAKLELSEQLRKEIRQIGTTMSMRSGLARLDLNELEPYEITQAFGDTSRLAERIQDFKLAVARACYRSGYSARIPLSLTLAISVLDDIRDGPRRAPGGAPTPERDWQDILSTIQAFDQQRLGMLIKKLSETSYSHARVKSKWNE